MNNNARRSEGSTERSIVSGALRDGRLVELVYSNELKQTMLAVGRDDAISIMPAVDDGETRICPLDASNNLIKHAAVLLPGPPAAFGSPSELAAAVQDYLRRYVDLSDWFIKIASYYVLLTWVYDEFNELPYLRLRGEYGSGKTRALIVIGSICYKAFFASGASTVSPIFHTLDTFRGTLVLDEADFRFSDEKAELVKILNNGNAKGFPVLRTAVTTKKEFDPRAFDVFGPKIVAMRRSFEDEALESRFLTEEMGQRRLRADIPISLPEAQKAEAESLRSKLLMYRFRYLGRTKAVDELVDRTLSPRLNQVLVPLLSIIDEEEVRTDVRRAARAYDAELAVARSASIEGGVLAVLAAAFADPDCTSVAVSEVTKRFVDRFGGDFERPATSRYIGGILRKRLHLVTYKSHGVYVVPASEKSKVTELAGRYGIADDDGDD
jgi:hypothetical protein